MHTDLKPENFLFDTPDEGTKLKATDFGLSIFYKPGLKRVGSELMESEIKALMNALNRFIVQKFIADIDNSGTIDYGEFIAATLHINKMEREENLIATFSFFDKDGSGYITIDELQQACRDFGLGDVQLDDTVTEIDQDNIGGWQYIVFPGRYIYTQRFKDANVNDKLGATAVNLVAGEKPAETNLLVLMQAVSRRAIFHETIRDYEQAASDLHRLISLLEKQSQEKVQQCGSGDNVKELRQARRHAMKVLGASPSAYSANPKSKLSNPPSLTGSAISLVSVVQNMEAEKQENSSDVFIHIISGTATGTVLLCQVPYITTALMDAKRGTEGRKDFLIGYQGNLVD
ncbi:hypothetical protein HYC85_025813 [Camellia sinensis]|uniref:Protein kinase domain-containing protein n=1 Tax=Camellia sinensis TaxID=4442 RepID=A0A7J7GCM7_CAMSI|nr:hypothetical protein HYC85_025813 [Camellia sinensis]